MIYFLNPIVNSLVNISNLFVTNNVINKMNNNQSIFLFE